MTVAISNDENRKIKSTFISAGVICAATLHLPPASSSEGMAYPAILMVHGWGGIQDALTLPFCDSFVQAGFAVMTFDYPTWGDSQGLPRNSINPWQRVRDTDAALAHLKNQAQVDQRRIILWGTSFGGGHVVELAAEHPELLGAISQVPMLDGRAALAATPLKRMLKLGAYALADLANPAHPVYIPVISPEGGFSTMDRDGAYDSLRLGLMQIPNSKPDSYDNRVTAKSILNIGLYRPLKRLKDIRIPTLLVGASRDSVAPFVTDTINKINNPHIQTELLDANHFEPYFEPALSQNLSYQLNFLKSLI